MKKYQVVGSFVTEEEALQFSSSVEGSLVLRTPSLKSVGVVRVPPSGSYHVVVKAGLFNRRSNPNFQMHTGGNVNRKVDTSASRQATQRKLDSDKRSAQYASKDNLRGRLFNPKPVLPYMTTRDEMGKPIHDRTGLLPGETRSDMVSDPSVNVLGKNHENEVNERDAKLAKQMISTGQDKSVGEHYGDEVSYDPIEEVSEVGQTLQDPQIKKYGDSF